MIGDMSGSENQSATKADIVVVRSDVTVMRGEMTGMRDEMMGMRGEMMSMRDEITGMRGEIRELFRPISITLTNHTAELADIRGHIKAKMVTREEFHSRMDGFAGRVDDFDYSSAKNRSRLDEHEKRISALEEKRA